MSTLKTLYNNAIRKLKNRLAKADLLVDYAVRHGNPSINSVLTKLQNSGAKELIDSSPLSLNHAGSDNRIQYVMRSIELLIVKNEMAARDLQIIPHYESEPLYISALVQNNKR